MRLGRYETVRLLGEGGQGVVHEALADDGRRVAVKILKAASDPATLKRLERELEAVRRVAPFCTAQILEAVLDGDEPYVVSEFVDGPSLHDRVASSGPLTGGELERLAVGTASALAAIHGAGVVHRDFKPANVLLGPDGPRVVDFGIARLAETGGVPVTRMIGTPGYMAPEQLDGAPASAASDVWSWAATMVFAATGSRPSPGMTFPDALRSVLERCLADDPAARPTAQEVLISLVNPNDAGTSPQAPKRSWLLPAAAAVAVALVSAATVAAWPDGQKAAGSPEPSPAPTIAAEFTGRWAGTVAEKQSKELLVVDLDLVPSHGTLSTARCVQRLDLRKSTATEVVLAGARSEKCDEIELTLSLRQGRLRYRSQNSSGTIAYEEELLRF